MVDLGKIILVIDDDDDVRMLVETRLKRAGYDVSTATNGLEGLKLFYSARPHAVVLDIAMPGMDGWQVLERLREVSDVPVLMLTALAEEKEKIKGLKSGADDYITKPFSGEELVARVEAVLRRVDIASADSPGGTYHDPELTIDFSRHIVNIRGDEVELSPTEFRLLAALAKDAGRVLSQDQLLDRVWGENYAESLEVVRLYIGYLRRKIEVDQSHPKLIETVRGFGYRYRKPSA